MRWHEQRLSLLHGYIQPSIPQGKQTGKVKKKEPVAISKSINSAVNVDNVRIADLVAKSKSESVDIVQLLKAHIPVVEVAI